jgi:hypothetical protein
MQIQFKDRPEWRRLPCVKRLAIKRQLRKRGIDIPEQINQDLSALRVFRRQQLAA